MLAASILLTGCAATQTALSHHDLSVQTKMTDSIFLDPVPPNEHTIFVQVRNTTDQPQFTIEGDLRDALVAKGYTVVADPSAAHYLLQVNVLSVGKANPSAAQKSFLGGYGSAIAGAAAGAAIGVVGGGIRRCRAGGRPSRRCRFAAGGFARQGRHLCGDHRCADQ
ncbi:MAG: complement resistance protein TraT [Magnetospirillum sp.]|nr:complement resistance protein TraT [Magnetospirillum sp.]